MSRGRPVGWRAGDPQTVSRIDDAGRECSLCGEYKPWEDYCRSTSPRAPHGKASACKSCRSAKYVYGKPPDGHRHLLLQRLGITQEDFDWLLSLFDGNCHLHGGPETKKDYRSGRLWWLSVDHDHSCCPEKRACRKCIRGLLCADCNMMLGLAERTGLAEKHFPEYMRRRPLVMRGGEAEMTTTHSSVL